MRAKLVATLLELAIGVIAGVVSFRLSDRSDPTGAILSIMVGVLSVILAANLVEPFLEERTFRRVTDRLDRILDGLSDQLLSSSDVARLLKYGTLHVPREHTTRAWLELLWGARNRYWGTSATAPGEVVDTSTFQLGMAILAAKVRVDQLDVRRLFIVDDEPELERMKGVFQAVAKAQIHVKYILRADIDRHPLLKAQMDQIPSLDFVVVDSRIAWFLLIDRDRRIRSGEAFWDRRLASRCEEAFSLLWESATTGA